jgi:hypothetical protein
MAKSEFAWDSEKAIGEVVESDKIKHELKLCILNDVKYISSTKWVLKKDGWAIAKNQVFKKSVFESIAHIVANVNLYE